MNTELHLPQRILVTGGAGFIGSNFLLHMVPKHPEVLFVNLDKLTYAGNLFNLLDIQSSPNYHFVNGDISNRELVGELFLAHDFTTVVHFAAESHVDRSILEPLAFVETNVLGTATLLDTARRSWKDRGPNEVRFHHISTDEVFGSLGEEGFFDETTPYDPKSPYSASKAASDHLVRAYAHTFEIPCVISNCSNNYGPYQFPEKLIPLVIMNAVQGKPIPVYGRGENVRDWIHVQDHCEALEMILLRGRNNETYVVGGYGERANIEIVNKLVELVDDELGRTRGTAARLITYVTDRPGHDFRYAIDGRKIEDDLGWTPRMNLEEGLRETVRWYLSNQDWLEAVADKTYLDYYEKQYAGR